MLRSAPQPSDLIQRLRTDPWPQVIDLAGVLIASGDLSHVIDDAPDDGAPCFGILLADGLIDRLAPLEIPLLAGASVMFTGHARFCCKLHPTGYRMLPYRMTNVFSFTFENEDVGRHEFTLTDIPYDVYVHQHRSADAEFLRRLQALLDRPVPVMQLRRALADNPKTLIYRRGGGEKLRSIEDELRAIGARYERICVA